MAKSSVGLLAILGLRQTLLSIAGGLALLGQLRAHPQTVDLEGEEPRPQKRRI
jgi:hypothetical protein